MLDKHTFTRLARSTLNELQQNQHEKASLLCVRVQSPSGLALVPCTLSMVDLSGQLRRLITQKQTFLVQKNDSNFYFRHPTLVRPARKKLFCLDSVASLPRPCLTIIKNSTKVILDGFETSHGEIPCVMSSKLSSVLGEIKTYLLGNLW